MGRGNLWWSWFHIADTVRHFEILLDNRQAKGVFTLMGPGFVTQAQFASVLGKQLKPPAFMPLPGFVVSLMMGEFGEEVLLKG